MSGKIYLMGDDGGLVAMEEEPYEAEALLQKLLAEYPDLLAGEQMRPSSPRRWLLVSRELGVPEVIIEKAPSADLWAGQTDEDELGYSYEDMDQLLFLLIEERMTAEACVEEGFEFVFVAEIVNRVKRYRYKSTLPLVGTVGQYPLSELEQLPLFMN